MMLPSEGTVPYPYQDEVNADEDGVGFALRMATRNGITFSQLARRFASTGHLTLPAGAASSLAFMFGADPVRLHAAFIKRYFHDGAYSSRFMGHDFRRPYHLRQTRPQICPVCISLHSHALGAWSIDMVTACPQHGIQLLDHCACGRPIRWRRPSVDFCECTRRLTPSDQKCRDASTQELAISSQIIWLLGSAHFRLQPSDSLLNVFDGLSIDTFVRLVWIFGIVDDDSAHSPPCSSRVLSTQEAAALCKRAYGRFARLLDRKRPVSNFGIHYAALSALRAECSQLPDMQFMESLSARLDRGLNLKHTTRSVASGAQFSLFDQSYV